MGYSCTMLADKTFRALMNLLTAEKSNEWTHNGRTFFAEIGRENRDGAITGKVVEVSTADADGRQHILTETSFRIDPNGSIVRFPHTPILARNTAENLTTEPFVVIPPAYEARYNDNIARG